MVKATQGPATKDANEAQSPRMKSEDGENARDGGDTPKNGAKQTPPRKAADEQTGKSAKKRRKVNHACIYCRRSHMTCDLERPCTRCVKRNIGHLCHDEPREASKKGKSDPNSLIGDHDTSKLDDSLGSDAGLTLAQLTPERSTSTTTLVQPTPVHAPQPTALGGNNQSTLGLQDSWLYNTPVNFAQDLHLHPSSYIFNTSEVSNEYNLLNDFLSNSLLEDGLFTNEDINGALQDTSLPSTMSTLNPNAGLFLQNQSSSNSQMLPPVSAALGNAISRPASGFRNDKAKETYYMTAADPAGSEAPEERLKKLLKAKYDAGLLKPFNYVKGYARMNLYMERHLLPASRVRILKQLEMFRPKFRERMQGLTDMQLVYVEMGFERRLMEYDRIFASMAIPACCWRRTGEIYRGNKEMAKLLHVPMEQLRDGKIAIHELFSEPTLVRYWEKFGQIAFDTSQKAILTACMLKNRETEPKEPEIKCCFSFTIRRDDHNIPSLIVGNFLPISEIGTLR